MKTKHFLWALALPAVIAACTNEDFEVTQPQQNPALDNRPMAGKVELNFGIGEVMTRLNQDFEFVVGDEIGATLMDEYKADLTSGDQIWGVTDKRYDFVDYIQTNYRYTNTESGWENSNLLCAGNYFFYYPYTATLNTRTAFEKYLNPNQELTANTSAGGRELVNDNQMYVGYQLVEGATEGSTSVLNVTMEPVFAFPLFTLMCTDSEPVTIQKIALQLQNKSHNLPLVATVQPGTNAANANRTVSGVTYIDYSQDPTLAVSMSEGPAKLDKNAVTGTRQIQVTFPEGTTTKNGQIVRTYMVIPAGDYSGTYNLASGVYGAAELLIYTNKGVVTADLSAPHENTGSTGGQNNVTNDVALGEVYGDIDKMPNGYRTINITFDEVAITKPAEFTATSTEDLDTYLEWYAGIGGTSDLYVKSTNQKTELSADAVAILANNKNITLNILGDITIAADVVSADFEAANIKFLGCGVSSTLTYDGNNLPIGVTTAVGTQTVINKATLANIPNVEVKNLTIQNEGSMTLIGTQYAVKFINKGTVNVNGNGTATSVTDFDLWDTTNGERHFENYGTLNFNDDAAATVSETTNSYNGWFNNYAGATVNIAEGVTASVRIDNLNDVTENPGTYGVINVDGTWNTYGSNGVNKGSIVVNGTLRVPTPTSANKYTNNATWTFFTKNGVPSEYTPIIENYGNITGITNNGLVKQASATASYITTGVTNATGRVDNTVISQQTTASDRETIIVTVDKAAEAAELNTLLQRAQAEAVVFMNAGSLNVTSVAEGVTEVTLMIPTVEINGNLNINVLEGVILNIRREDQGATSVVVKSGTTSLVNDTHVILGTSSYGSKVEVCKDATLNVNANATLESINIDFTNDGKIRNYGTIIDRDTDTVGNWEGKAPVTK